MILHIAKYSSFFKYRLDKHCANGTIFSTCNMKSLYTNIWHDLFYPASEYEIGKLQNDLPLLQCFNKQFILEGLVKGTAMGTKFAPVGSNVVVAYEEIKMFALLPQLNQQNFV